MGLTREEIVGYAMRYIAAADVGDFPMDGDLFCLFSRTTDSDGGPAREPRWEFQGYGICRGYRCDEAAKPAGKWLWFEYVSLTTFPPHMTALKLQPPHVVTGTFHSSDRSREMRVVKLPPDSITQETGAGGSAPAADMNAAEPQEPVPQNVLRFPGPRKRTRP